MAPQKDNHIETLRGIACILLVLHHILLDNTIALSDGWKYLDSSLLYIRLPLFTFISGYVYSLRPVKPGSIVPFLAKKCRRLLLPFLLLNPIYLVFQRRFALDGLTVQTVLLTYVEPVAPLWYLQALCYAFIAVVVLEQATLLKSFPSTVAVLCLSATASLLLGVLPEEPVKLFTSMSIYGATYLLPYFLLGLACVRFPALTSKYTFRTALLGLLIGLTMHQYCLATATSAHWLTGRFSPLGLLVSVAAMLTLVNCKFVVMPLAKVGAYSYPIYLFHMVPIIAVRTLMHTGGVPTTGTLIAASLLPALLLPICMELLTRYSPLLGFLLLGKRASYRLFALPQKG